MSRREVLPVPESWGRGLPLQLHCTLGGWTQPWGQVTGPLTSALRWPRARACAGPGEAGSAPHPWVDTEFLLLIRHLRRMRVTLCWEQWRLSRVCVPLLPPLSSTPEASRALGLRGLPRCLHRPWACLCTFPKPAARPPSHAGQHSVSASREQRVTGDRPPCPCVSHPCPARPPPAPATSCPGQRQH
jgi:hypothetical protein